MKLVVGDGAGIKIRKRDDNDAEIEYFVSKDRLNEKGLLEAITPTNDVKNINFVAPEFLDGTVDRRVNSNTESPQTPPTGWPYFWDLAKYALPRKTRERVYEPAHHELLEDLEESKKYKSKVARIGLALCFSFRTTLLFLDCWRALLTDKSFHLLIEVMPTAITEWWTRPRF